MLVVLIITALFVALSVYFFFRAEKLQQSILVLKRETSINLKQSTALTESIALIASNQEGFAKDRLQKLLDNNSEQQSNNNVELIKPLINNYLIIFSECLKGKGKLQSITKQCFENQSTYNYKEFVNKVIKSDAKIQRLWSSNNLIGFVSLVEALLVKYDVTHECNIANKSTST